MTTTVEQDIQAKGLTAPRVTPESIENQVLAQYSFNAWDAAGQPKDAGSDSLKLLTICVLTLHNGFTVVGKSACASPENYDAAIGAKVARVDAINQIWPLEGYLLKHKLHTDKGTPAA